MLRASPRIHRRLAICVNTYASCTRKHTGVEVVTERCFLKTLFRAMLDLTGTEVHQSVRYFLLVASAVLASCPEGGRAVFVKKTSTDVKCLIVHFETLKSRANHVRRPVVQHIALSPGASQDRGPNTGKLVHVCVCWFFGCHLFSFFVWHPCVCYAAAVLL